MIISTGLSIGHILKLNLKKKQGNFPIKLKQILQRRLPSETKRG
jgi:hypothetical protein